MPDTRSVEAAKTALGTTAATAQPTVTQAATGAVPALGLLGGLPLKGLPINGIPLG